MVRAPGLSCQYVVGDVFIIFNWGEGIAKEASL